MASEHPTVLIVPGLRDASADHWQTHLEIRLKSIGRKVQTVPPIGKNNNSCMQRVEGLARAVSDIAGPIVLVAHSGGCITVAHWALLQSGCERVQAALLAVPPDFETPLPAGYPTPQVLESHGWLPVPRAQLPFPSVVVASSNDPLSSLTAVQRLAMQWNSRLVNVGEVGHLNPASGFGPWPMAETLLS